MQDLDRKMTPAEITEYERNWKPLGWSREGFLAVRYIDPVPFIRASSSKAVNSLPLGPGSSNEQRIAVTASLVTPSTMRGARDQIILNVDEAEIWYALFDSPNVMTLGWTISTMYWWGVTPTDVERYRAELQVPARRSLRGAEVYLWMRFPRRFIRNPDPEKLADLTAALVQRCAEEALTESERCWVERQINICDAVEYFRMGMDPGEAKEWEDRNPGNSPLAIERLRSWVSETGDTATQALAWVRQMGNIDGDPLERRNQLVEDHSGRHAGFEALRLSMAESA